MAAACRDLALRLQTLSSLFGKISRVDDGDNTVPFSTPHPFFFFCRLTDEKDKTLPVSLASVQPLRPQRSAQNLRAGGGSAESRQERKSEKLNARNCYIINYRRHIIAYSLDKAAAGACRRPPSSRRRRSSLAPSRSGALVSPRL